MNYSILRAAGTAWFGSKAECAEMSRVEMGVGDFGYCPKCGNRAVVFDLYYDVECDWLDIWCAACGNYIDADELCELSSTATSYRIGDGPDAYWEDGRDE